MSPWTRFCPVAHPDQRRSKRSLGKIIIDKGGDDGDDDDDDLKNEYVLGVIEYMQYNLLACSGLNCNAHLISWRNPRGPVANLLSHSCLHFTVPTLLLTFHWSFTLSYISSPTIVCALSGNGSRSFRSPFFIKFFICSSSFHHRTTSTIRHRTNKTNYPQWKSIK